MKFKKILKIIKSRYFIFGVIVTIMFAALGLRLSYLTVEMGESYYIKAQERKMTTMTLRGDRGNILDRNGIPLAVNRQAYIVQVDRQWLPAMDEDRNEVVRQAIEIINNNGDRLLDNLPIKYGTRVYEDTLPYAIEGLYYDFGTSDQTEHRRRYDKWRKDANLEKVDLPAQEMLDHLRDRYKIDEKLSDQEARNIISIRLDLFYNRYRQNEPVRIAENISDRTLSQIETYSDKLPGVQTAVESSRYYPNGRSAQHIVGYVGKITDANMEAFRNKNGDTITAAGYSLHADKYGQDGIEAYAEHWLTGSTKDKHGLMLAETDALRQVVKVLEEELPKSGNDVFLSIDSRLQRSAENILEEEVKKLREGLPPYEGDRQAPLANSGAIVILDVNTGEILTMASYANSDYPYDLNDFARGISQEEYSNLENDLSNPLFPIAFQGGMEPGSVFKMMVGMAALMEGHTTINETIYDRYRLSSDAPACWRQTSHGSLNIMDAIKVSCNYYFTTIGYRMGIDKLYKWGENFGLQGPTGLELLTIDGRTDMNYVAHPDYRDELNKVRARSQIRRELLQKYGVEASFDEINTIVDIERSKLYDYLRSTGWFADNEESSQAYYDILSIFSDLPRWTAMVETTRASIGQSDTSVSPLAVARYIAAVANGGKVLETHVVKEVKSPEGEIINETEPVFTQLDLKDEYVAAIQEGMRRVVYQRGGPGGNGSASAAFLDIDPSITLGGKTGTAQTQGGRDTNIAWFGLFTPYEDPEVAIVVTLPNGGGSSNATPVARRMLEEYYRLLREEEQDDLPDLNNIVQ
ncbi:MAG TPA: penicillin-binding transpeptidase domain-containing protein [Bacillota bacterium]|nr:penicillin-binding transpeptidase domain-containing protein [Bacillota bacterium]